MIAFAAQVETEVSEPIQAPPALPDGPILLMKNQPVEIGDLKVTLLAVNGHTRIKISGPKGTKEEVVRRTNVILGGNTYTVAVLSGSSVTLTPQPK